MLEGFIVALLFLASIIITISVTVTLFFSSDSIESKERIEPQIELIIENNKVDTLYVYRAKKN